MEWFASSPALRLLAGALFFVPFGWAFFRLSRGLGRAFFALLCGALAALFLLSPTFHLLAFLPLAVFVLAVLRRAPSEQAAYQPAAALVESGGIKRGLTPAEAAVVLESRLPTVLTVVLVGLLKKRVLQINGEEPLVLALDSAYRSRAESADPGARAAHRRAVAQSQNVVLHPYEEPFLVLFEDYGKRSLEGINFTAPARALIRQVARRVQGHNLDATREYYRKHLGRARHDAVRTDEQADERTLARLRAHHLEWLVLDEDFATLYENYRAEWLAPLGGRAPGLGAAVARLEALLANAIPPPGLTLRSPNHGRLSLTGRDRISAAYLEAVIAQMN